MRWLFFVLLIAPFSVSADEAAQEKITDAFKEFIPCAIIISPMMSVVFDGSPEVREHERNKSRFRQYGIDHPYFSQENLKKISSKLEASLYSNILDLLNRPLNESDIVFHMKKLEPLLEPLIVKHVEHRRFLLENPDELAKEIRKCAAKHNLD